MVSFIIQGLDLSKLTLKTDAKTRLYVGRRESGIGRCVSRSLDFCGLNLCDLSFNTTMPLISNLSGSPRCIISGCLVSYCIMSSLLVESEKPYYSFRDHRSKARHRGSRNMPLVCNHGVSLVTQSCRVLHHLLLFGIPFITLPCQIWYASNPLDV